MSDFSLLIREWYRPNKRNLPWRNSDNPYFIWLSEIIMQQTRVEQGLSYYNKFISNYPTVQDLANASEEDILNDWQGLGYYSRARNLHAAAKFICNELNGEFPNNYESILQLKGIGQYTASAISSFAFGECKAVVDGNVYRLLSRVFDIDTPIDSTIGKKKFQQLADELIDCKRAGEHNQAIMEVGAMICSPNNPLCMECPLNELCLAKEKGTISQRPVKSKKVKVRKRNFHFLIYQSEGKTVIEKRTASDIWKNMYQFPLIEVDNTDKNDYSKPWKDASFQSEKITHILSHQKIIAVFHHINHLPEQLNSNQQIILQENIQDYPLPRLIDKYLMDFSHLF